MVPAYAGMTWGRGDQGRRGFAAALSKLGAYGSAPEAASGAEFILEGLHLNRRLNRDEIAGGHRYRI